MGCQCATQAGAGGAPSSLQERFTLDGHLGQGGSGHVYRATRKDKPRAEPVAVKTVLKGDARAAKRVKTEIDLMKALHHPNVLKLHESLEDDFCVYLVLEFCSGGELFDRVARAGRLEEAAAAVVVRQLFEAVHYMHESHVCHRDIKAENILFKKAGSIENCRVKVADFGLACQCKPGQVLTEKVGTNLYTSPQVLKGKYGRSCDLWSCGVVLYMVLCGDLPFNGKTRDEICKKVAAASFQFRREDWEGVSEVARSLVDALLTYNDENRYTAEMALKAEWLELSPKSADIGRSGVPDAAACKPDATAAAALRRCPEVVYGYHGGLSIDEIQVLPKHRSRSKDHPPEVVLEVGI